MRVKVAAIAASICLALPFSVSLYAAEKQDPDKTLTCKDGTTEHAGKGAGAFAWKGQMMDQPHLTRAKKIADRARRAGVI